MQALARWISVLVIVAAAAPAAAGKVGFLDTQGAIRGVAEGRRQLAILDAWAYYREPWLWPEHMQRSHRLYAKLRHRLAPYLYTALWQANQTGVESSTDLRA